MEAVNCQVHAASTSHHDGQKYDPHNPMNHKDISPHSAGRHLSVSKYCTESEMMDAATAEAKKNDEENEENEEEEEGEKKAEGQRRNRFRCACVSCCEEQTKEIKKRGGRESIDVALSVWWEPTGRLFFNYRVGKGRPKKKRIVNAIG